jgi:hypothetical protein
MKNTAFARTEYELRIFSERFNERIILKLIGLCWCTIVPARGFLVYIKFSNRKEWEEVSLRADSYGPIECVQPVSQCLFLYSY